MEQVWVAETWEAHGYGHDVHGVYDSREAAFEALKAMPNMTVYVDAAGDVRGRPRKERDWGRAHALAEWNLGVGWSMPPERWAHAHAMQVESRKEPAVTSPTPGSASHAGG